MPVKASNYAANWLQSKGVTLVLGEYIVDWGAAQTTSTKVLKTDQGRMLEANLVYKCIGFAPCSDVVSLQAPESGHQRAPPVGVDKTLQVREDLNEQQQ